MGVQPNDRFDVFLDKGLLPRVTIWHLQVGVSPASELSSMRGYSISELSPKGEKSHYRIWMDGCIHLLIGSDEGSS